MNNVTNIQKVFYKYQLNDISLLTQEDCRLSKIGSRGIQSISDIVKEGYYACVNGKCQDCKRNSDCDEVKRYLLCQIYSLKSIKNLRCLL